MMDATGPLMNAARTISSSMGYPDPLPDHRTVARA
jgi:hypothetical protein